MALMTCLPTLGAQAARVPLTLWYDQPAKIWMTSALPIGNGHMGAMFFGGVKNEQVQFNEKTLWTGGTAIRGAYQNFGSLQIEMDGDSTCTDYRRELSLDNALGSVSYTTGGTQYVRKYFASHPDDVIVVRLETPGSKGQLGFTLAMKGGRDEATTARDGKLKMSGAFETICYEAQATVHTEGGTLTASDGKLVVSGADAATIMLCCATNFDLTSPSYTSGDASLLSQRIDDTLQKATSKGFDKLLADHKADYQALFGRVSLDLNADVPAYPTDELVRHHKYNQYLDMLYFQYGRYLMLGSSRDGNMPSNLQGVWNNSNTPPWESDYHSNINVQMNYWPAEVTNLSECHLPFINYVFAEATKTDGIWQGVAREENCRGWAVKTQCNAFGYTDWNINRPANAWYCTHLWQHYAYTLDKEYLRQTAWPVMKLTCQYWFDRLVERDGKLLSPDDWSPEHGPWTDGPAYAQQLVSALFKQTLAAAAELGISDDFTTELQDKYRRIDRGLNIGPDGQLREWLTDFKDSEVHHRHLSHLIALYPCNDISYLQDKAVADAAKAALVARGDGATGWSRAWKISCWARLGDGNHAYKLLKQAMNITDKTFVSAMDDDGGVYPNLFCAHPPFQIDGNFGATAGIAEMLIQNTVRGVQLLPALPTTWSAGQYSGLRAKGGFTFDVKWSQGKPQTATVHSAMGQELRLYSPTATPQKVTNAKGKKVKFTVDGNGTVTLPTQAGATYHFIF